MAECVNTCGGLNDPSDSLICSETDCDNYGLMDRQEFEHLSNSNIRMLL